MNVKCDKHDVPYQSREMERGKTMQFCPECEGEQKAVADSIFEDLPSLGDYKDKLYTLNPKEDSRDTG